MSSGDDALPTVTLAGRRVRWNLDAETVEFDPPTVRAVALCCFRTCEWSSSVVPTAPREVADELIARHLLAEHEPELRTLGRLAQDADLIP